MIEAQSPSIEAPQVAEADCSLVLKEPNKFKVFLLNDDYTPMDFVVDVLEQFFYLGEDVAVAVMLQVHNQGRGLCGLFTRDVAETKVVQVNEYARNNGHPLLCSMEPD